MECASERELTNPFLEETPQTLAAAVAAFRPANALREALDVVAQHTEELAAKRDVSLYTGLGGVAVMYLQLSDAADAVASDEQRRAWLQTSRRLADRCLARTDWQERQLFQKVTAEPSTMLCGDVGVIAVATVVYFRAGQVRESVEMVRYIVRALQNDVKRESPELLYGRAGFVCMFWCLLAWLRARLLKGK